uniref:Uncharacterized protein n=1 Tax=Cereibacter sphaeroides (strain ATCC 17025 / ATH 2.4.3) TaxID=349102 RepID=A4WQQ3_CERS5
MHSYFKDGARGTDCRKGVARPKVVAERAVLVRLLNHTSSYATFFSAGLPFVVDDVTALLCGSWQTQLGTLMPAGTIKASTLMQDLCSMSMFARWSSSKIGDQIL